MASRKEFIRNITLITLGLVICTAIAPYQYSFMNWGNCGLC